MRRGARLTLLSLVGFVVLGLLNNIAATIFASRFGVGLLDLDGGASLIAPAGPAGLPVGGPDRVLAILALYSPAAVSAHVWLTLTLDLLFPVAVVLFGWFATRNLRTVLNAGPLIAAVGITLSVGYGLGELAENTAELALLLGGGNTAAAIVVSAMHVVKNVVAGLLLAYLAVGYLAAAVRRRVRRPAVEGL